MARFSLSSHPWELIFVYRVHNSTVSKQLRYALTKERLLCREVTPAAYAPYVVDEMGEDVCAPTVCGAGCLPVLLIIAQHQEPHTNMHWTSLQHCLSE